MWIALALVLVDVTGNAATSGIISGAAAATGLVLSVFGGALADVVSRRRLISTAVRVSLIANICLTAFTVTWALFPKSAGFAVWGIVFAALLSSGATGFAGPAFDGALKSLITPAQYPRAASAASARGSVVSVASSPASGALYSMHPAAPFTLSVLCDLGFLVTLRKIRTNLGPPAANTECNRSLVRAVADYRASFKFITGQRALLRVLCAAPLVNIVVFTATTWTALYLRAQGTPAGVVGMVVAGLRSAPCLAAQSLQESPIEFQPGSSRSGGWQPCWCYWAATSLSPENRYCCLSWPRSP